MKQEMNLAFGVNFDLLKTNLSAMFEKNENGSKFLLIPTKIDSPTSVTLGDMIADFKKALGQSDADIDKIKTSLESVKEGDTPLDLEKITFKLQAAFLYKDMPNKKQEVEKAQEIGKGQEVEKKEQEQEGQGEPAEYAVAILVDMSEALPDFGFVKLNSLFIAVWNTKRESVLKQIGTGNILKMLENL